jgi:hypothetical protein
MNTYSVVKFTEDNSLEAVPTNWLKKNKCAWSITKNYSTIRKLIERKIIPNEIKYTYFNARLLKTTGKLFKNIIFNRYSIWFIWLDFFFIYLLSWFIFNLYSKFGIVIL